MVYALLSIALLELPEMRMKFAKGIAVYHDNVIAMQLLQYDVQRCLSRAALTAQKIRHGMPVLDGRAAHDEFPYQIPKGGIKILLGITI